MHGPRRPPDDHCAHALLPADCVGGSNDPLRRNEHTVALARHIDQRRKLGYRHSMLQVRDVISNDDCARTERCQE